MKYLTLIRTIALLHQYQRPVQKVRHNGNELEYIEVSKKDIEVANRLAHEVLGKSLDELPPQTRRLLILLDEMVKAECVRLGMDRCDYRFTRRMVREHTGLGNTQLKIHLQRLEEMEYVVVHHAGHSQRNWYELTYDGQGKENRSFMAGLIDPEKLEMHHYDENRSGLEANRSGQNVDWPGTGRGVVGPWSGGGRGDEKQESSLSDNELEETGPEKVNNALKGKEKESHSSYVLIDPESCCSGYPMAAKSQGSL